VEIEDLSDIGSNIPAYCRALEASLKATLKYRVPTLIVHSYLTPKIIYYLATEELLEDKERVKKIYTTDIQEIALSVLMKIPGVGPKTAARLLSTFKSLKGIANASLEDLLSVQGVGRQKAKLIYDVFHTEFRR
jgi:ERCC4-type nuclease